MKRGVSGCAATALLMFVSLGCEITAAAETTEDNKRGFYVGASASRVEQDAEGEGQTLVSVPRLGVLLLRPNQTEVDDTQAGWNVTGIFSRGAGCCFSTRRSKRGSARPAERTGPARRFGWLARERNGHSGPAGPRAWSIS